MKTLSKKEIVKQLKEFQNLFEMDEDDLRAYFKVTFKNDSESIYDEASYTELRSWLCAHLKVRNEHLINLIETGNGIRYEFDNRFEIRS